MMIERRGRLIATALSVLGMISMGTITAASVLLISVGTILIVLGVVISYRVASVFGFMTLALGSGISVELTSMTEASSIVGAAAGILVPVYVLGWVALSSEVEGPVDVDLRSRATAFTVVFTVLCTLSVPIFGIVVGMTMPSVTAHLTVMTEIAIMLLAVAVSAVILTARTPKTIAATPTEEKVASPRK